MDDLPDHLVWEIFSRINKTLDRNSLSLTCKRLYRQDNEQRRSLRVGSGLHPANEALPSLCARFPNLTKIEIIYSGWMSKFGKQLDDQDLLILSNNCPSLTNLTLMYCTFITDRGLSHLAFCSNLSKLKLNFAPRVTGCGVFSIVSGCKKLRTLHIIRCINVCSVEWLEHLGKLQILEDLSIKNCRAIGEGDLIKLGPGWKKLRKFQFEGDLNYKYMKVYDRLAIDRWKKQWVSCDSMKDLSLVNCITNPGRGLACILDQCENLENINLDTCFGVRDCDITKLAKKSANLRSFSLRIPSDFSIPLAIDNSSSLTHESLKAIAQNCSRLESVKLAFSKGEFRSFSPNTFDGITSLIKMCPTIKVFSFEYVYSLNDLGMEALCLAENLHTLELERCSSITDEGIKIVTQFSNLRVLRVRKCIGVTDDGFKPLVGSYKLEALEVYGCPLVSAQGVEGVAKAVAFKQDLSWMGR